MPDALVETARPPCVSATAEAGERPQSFVFTRELSEVYLLLDHISGRPDKELPSGSSDLANAIEQVCAIGWPPRGTVIERAHQASTLLRVKDALNRAAQPANGASIAFTILVTGGEADPVPAPVREHGWEDPPSRMSLAILAFPGLLAPARRFRRRIGAIILAMSGWLLFTCAMSWNIAAGHAILSQLDTLAKVRSDILAQIGTADMDEERRAANAAPASGAIRPFCERHRGAVPHGVEQFDSIAALRACQPLDENVEAHRVAYANLADWLLLWSAVKWLPHQICGGTCLATGSDERPLTQNATDEQWASILNQVLGGAVLPVCYGILGAAAAIVRDLWRKMHDSLLSPRDLTLALGQLALGAVIGACIGLFVTPSGSGDQAIPPLTGSVTLSASALSFIAGFGVEGVFVALEGFIKRVFNLK